MRPTCMHLMCFRNLKKEQKSINVKKGIENVCCILTLYGLYKVDIYGCVLFCFCGCFVLFIGIGILCRVCVG